jgi:hypothetical protein
MKCDLQPQKGPNGVQPPSLEMNNYNLWPTAVIPDVEEGAVGQSQAQAAQMRDRRALPLRRSKLKKKSVHKQGDTYVSHSHS